MPPHLPLLRPAGLETLETSEHVFNPLTDKGIQVRLVVSVAGVPCVCAVCAACAVCAVCVVRCLVSVCRVLCVMDRCIVLCCASFVV